MTDPQTPPALSACCRQEVSYLETDKGKSCPVCTRCGNGCDVLAVPKLLTAEKVRAIEGYLNDDPAHCQRPRIANDDIAALLRERAALLGLLTEAADALVHARYLIDFAPTKAEGADEAYKLIAKMSDKLSPFQSA